MDVSDQLVRTKIVNLLKSYCDTYGGEHLIFGPATPEAANAMVGVDSAFPFITNYPDEWITTYVNKKYIEIDPIIKYAALTTTVFSWKTLKADLNMPPKVKKFWKDAGKYGINCGITIPLHGPRNQSFMLSLASNTCTDCNICFCKNEIQVLAYQFYIEYVTGSIDILPDVELTKREKDVMYWTSQGKSAWDISIILSISENTVNFHLKNIMKKLDVTNKVAASVKAVRLGLISI